MVPFVSLGAHSLVSMVIIFSRFDTIHERDGQTDPHEWHEDTGCAYTQHYAVKTDQLFVVVWSWIQHSRTFHIQSAAAFRETLRDD